VHYYNILVIALFLQSIFKVLKVLPLWKKCGRNEIKIDTAATIVEKADNKIKELYNKVDSVLQYEREKYFSITLEQ